MHVARLNLNNQLTLLYQHQYRKSLNQSSTKAKAIFISRWSYLPWHWPLFLQKLLSFWHGWVICVLSSWFWFIVDSLFFTCALQWTNIIYYCLQTYHPILHLILPMINEHISHHVHISIGERSIPRWWHRPYQSPSRRWDMFPPRGERIGGQGSVPISRKGLWGRWGTLCFLCFQFRIWCMWCVSSLSYDNHVLYCLFHV